jgi:cbb3-type cytochrome oxidase maturation protein
MSVIIVLILVSLAVGLIFLGAFVWSVRSGQYEDTLTPAMRMLLEDAPPRHPLPETGGNAVPLPVRETAPGNGPTKNNK